MEVKGLSDEKPRGTKRMLLKEKLKKNEQEWARERKITGRKKEEERTSENEGSCVTAAHRWLKQNRKEVDDVNTEDGNLSASHNWTTRPRINLALTRSV